MKLYPDIVDGKENSFIFSSSNMVLTFSWFRITVLSAVYLSALLIQVMQSDFLSPEVWQPINVIFAIAFGAHFLLIEFFNKLKSPKKLLVAIFYLDSALLSVAIGILGLFNPMFLFLFLINLTVGSFVCGLQNGLKLVFWTALTLNISLSLSSHFDPKSLGATFFVNNISMFLSAILSGYLGDQVGAISNDIEEKTATIKELKNINELIVDNIPSGLLVINDKFYVEKANRGAAKIFNDLSLENRPLQEISSEIYNELIEYSGAAKKSSFQRTELKVENFKNEKLILEVILSSIRFGIQNDNKFLCLLQNVTEVRNLELAMQQKEKLAAVGQLAAGIAHEIRNPLASISGSVQLLQTDMKLRTPEEKKLLAIVVKEIDRLNNLITEFLDYVRPDVRVEDTININTLVSDVLDILVINDKLAKNVDQRKELRARNIIYGHYDKLKQAIMNIIINSYQALGDTLRPEIYVHSYDAENQVVLIIQDNGIGMSKETQRRMFEPFHTTKSGGTGLGLAITHKILETHRATVRVDSELGHGTKFSIVFPAGITPDENRAYLKKQA